MNQIVIVAADCNLISWAGCADLRLTTTGTLQTMVNAQSARVVNLGAVAGNITIRQNVVNYPLSIPMCFWSIRDKNFRSKRFELTSKGCTS